MTRAEIVITHFRKERCNTAFIWSNRKLQDLSSPPGLSGYIAVPSSSVRRKRHKHLFYKHVKNSSAGGESTGTFCNKHGKWKFVLSLKQPSKAGNQVFLKVILRSLFSGLISKPLTFISTHNWVCSFGATVT